jgi:tripartite-type tricarboxylate transporter receptor subunit TctC
MSIQRRTCLLAAAAVLWPGARAAEAAWPTRPLRLVTGGAGGVTDIRARWLAERLGAALGQPVVVDNVPAAGGAVSAEQVARSAPDGYTLLFTHQGIAAVTPHLHARLGYDALADFAPVTRLGHGSLLLVAGAALPAGSAAELIALARRQAGEVSYGSPGVATPPHLAGALFVRSAEIQAIHVPFKGGGALAHALLGGHVGFAIEGLTAMLPHVRSGRLRALGVTGTERSPLLPEVPTIAQSGLPGYEFAGWTGIVAPAATPRPVIERLNAEIVRIAESPEGRQWFETAGAEPGTQAPEAFGEFMRAEYTRWGRVVRDVGMKAE